MNVIEEHQHFWHETTWHLFSSKYESILLNPTVPSINCRATSQNLRNASSPRRWLSFLSSDNISKYRYLSHKHILLLCSILPTCLVCLTSLNSNTHTCRQPLHSAPQYIPNLSTLPTYSSQLTHTSVYFKLSDNTYLVVQAFLAEVFGSFQFFEGFVELSFPDQQTGFVKAHLIVLIAESWILLERWMVSEKLKWINTPR